MRATVHPGGFEGGRVWAPGDKSISHRWLILAATAEGVSEVRGLPPALDVRSTARCLSALVRDETQRALDAWDLEAAASAQGDRSTGNRTPPRVSKLRIQARGRGGLHAPGRPLECGNSGTSMRMLCGVLAAVPFETELRGDKSLSTRPMERVAEPLRAMGADVQTTDGHAPVSVRGARLHGVEHVSAVPSAQVKSAILLAGLAAEGETIVREPVQTRDHTERALGALGAPVWTEQGRVGVRGFQHPGFAATVPGDLSSAAFLIGAAALTGSALRVDGVGLNPTRIGYLEVLARMGVHCRAAVEREELGEPVGALQVDAGPLRGTTVEASELPHVIDEVPVLALVSAYARGETRFLGAGELRVKESDRLVGVVEAIRGLGGEASAEGNDLVVAGGGLRGGIADTFGDHRLAMAIAVAALAAPEPTTIDGLEAAEVSFPGFVATLRSLGARVEA